MQVRGPADVDGTLFALTLISTLGCGLIAGAFFVFSSMVMPALARLPAAQGIAAMQSINIVAVQPAFLSVFVGTAVACLLLAGWSLFVWQKPGAEYLLAGSLLYVVGCFAVTIAFHVPRNDALAAADPSSAAGATLWATYLSEWTTGNHLRALASLAATALLTLALWSRNGGV